MSAIETKTLIFQSSKPLNPYVILQVHISFKLNYQTFITSHREILIALGTNAKADGILTSHLQEYNIMYCPQSVRCK
jgi:hypothetical protein